MSPESLMLAPLKSQREQAIERLGELYANDEITLDDFERRVTLAQSAASIKDLEELIGAALVPVAGKALATALPGTPGPASSSVTAILGGVERGGPWTCPSQLRVTAFMGGVELDFRYARLPPGPVQIDVVAIMGGVEITVPPDVAVRVEGTAILGGVSHLDRLAANDGRGTVLEIRGLAFMGGVEVKTASLDKGDPSQRLRSRDDARSLPEHGPLESRHQR